MRSPRALALTLAAVGIYGVTSFSVATRRSEIGIRRAFGASDHRVAGEVVRRVAGLTAIGVVLGTVGSLGAGRLASHRPNQASGRPPEG